MKKMKQMKIENDLNDFFYERGLKTMTQIATTSKFGDVSYDSEDKVAKGATKFDGDKSPVYQGFIKYFPRAIEQVANISKFGYEKYGTWGGWLDVDDGLNRYMDAKCRHMIDEAKGEDCASDSKLLHAAHEAWNAMAKLELLMRERESGDTN